MSEEILGMGEINSRTVAYYSRGGVSFIGAFVNLRRATILFNMSVHASVCPSVRMKQLGSHWTDFYEICYLCTFRKTVEKMQVSLKSDKNGGYFR